MMRRKVVIVLVMPIICVVLCFLWLSYDIIPPKELGSIRLNIETYLAGKNQPTHPSVVVFPEDWNGTKYWLAYSPYPYGNGEEENPCLAVSNDMYFWKTPAGLANPIADNEETGCDELKDPHLLYREDLGRLEMWYLGRLAENLGGDGESLLLMRKYTYDGISWCDGEVMTSTEYLSPTVYWDGTKYQLWGIGYDLWNTNGTIVYQESLDGLTWTKPVRCFLGLEDTNIDIWHGSVSVFDGIYHFVFIDKTDKQEIFYCSSTDGVHFSVPEAIVENNGYWDFLYRPTLVFDDDNVYCLYGVVNHANQWYISMSIGSSENELLGLRDTDLEQMCLLSDEVCNTHSLRYKLEKLYTSTQDYLRPELLILAAIESLLLGFIKKLRNQRTLCICVFVNLLLSIVYIYIRIRPFSAYSWIGATIAVSFLNLSMAAILQCVAIFLSKGFSNETKST